MGDLGLMGIDIPEEYGGTGLDTLAYAVCWLMSRVGVESPPHSVLRGKHFSFTLPADIFSSGSQF